MHNKKLVQSYFDTFFSGKARHSKVRSWLTDDFEFVGPLMTAHSADEYVNQLTAMGDEMELYAEVRKLLAEEDTVAALVAFQGPSGGISYSQWFTLREGKIAKLEVVYDPRSFIEAG